MTHHPIHTYQGRAPGLLPMRTPAALTAVPGGPPMCCPRCDADTPDGAKFGGECALPEGPLPPGRADTLPRAKFCSECGTPLTPQTPAPPAHPQLPVNYLPTHLAAQALTSSAALEGECKQVTVLFADLKGSLELLADRDPEEACRLLDPVLDCMMDAVHWYEGTVHRVMGDGLMALFGAPIPDDASVVQAYLGTVQRSYGVSLPLRFGLNTGMVEVRGSAFFHHR